MGMIEYNGKVKVFQTDKDIFKVVKVREQWKCGKCNSIIPNKGYCFGKGYIKFCLDCGIDVFKTFMEKIQALGNHLKKSVPTDKGLEDLRIKNMVEDL